MVQVSRKYSDWRKIVVIGVNVPDGSSIECFEIVGEIRVCCYAKCTSTCGGGGEVNDVQLGGNITSNLFGQGTVGDLAANKYLNKNGASQNPIIDIEKDNVIMNSAADTNILLAGLAGVTAGTFTVYCFWKPMSSDGAVINV